MSNKKIKRLFFDIETSPNVGLFWSAGIKQTIDYDNILEERAIICICFKWEGKGVQYLTWDKHHNDKSMLEKFIKIANTADELVGHNCVEINTPVLTQDLKWVKAGDLVVGQKLAGFEEGNRPGFPVRDRDSRWNSGYKRKLIGCEVTNFTIEEADCLRVTFDNGDSIITTRNHYWLSMGIKDNYQKWRMSSDLKPGHRIIKYFSPWEKEDSYEGGWLSGFISGEGTLKAGGDSGLSIDFCQRPGVTWSKALETCRELGINVSKKRAPKTGGLGKQDTLYTGITGGKFKTLEYIGRLEIDRFLQKINWNKLGYLKGKGLEVAKVVKVEEVGVRKVAVFSTSSKTFFGAGYPMHNCDKYDLAWIRTRCLFHRIPMFPSYTTVDTLKVSRSKFRFNSNRLDYISKYLGIGKKIKTGGFDLWKKVMLNDAAALKKMVNYCKGDVRLLEDVYSEMRNHIPPKTSVTQERRSCPECGSNHSIIHKRRISGAGLVKIQMQCQDCGKFNTIPGTKK